MFPAMSGCSLHVRNPPRTPLRSGACCSAHDSGDVHLTQTTSSLAVQLYAASQRYCRITRLAQTARKDMPCSKQYGRRTDTSSDSLCSLCSWQGESISVVDSITLATGKDSHSPTLLPSTGPQAHSAMPLAMVSAARGAQRGLRLVHSCLISLICWRLATES